MLQNATEEGTVQKEMLQNAIAKVCPSTTLVLPTKLAMQTITNL